MMFTGLCNQTTDQVSEANSVHSTLFIILYGLNENKAWEGGELLFYLIQALIDLSSASVTPVPTYNFRLPTSNLLKFTLDPGNCKLVFPFIFSEI